MLADGLHYFEKPVMPKHGFPGQRESCHVKCVGTQHAGLASSQAAAPGAPASSQAAAALPPSCVVCPVLHPPDSVSLRQVQSPVSQQTLERLCWFADQCTLERGRGRAASTG